MALSFFQLKGERYRRTRKSALLPKLDPALIARCMRESTQTAAVKALRAAMRPAPRLRRS